MYHFCKDRLLHGEKVMLAVMSDIPSINSLPSELETVSVKLNYDTAQMQCHTCSQMFRE